MMTDAPQADETVQGQPYTGSHGLVGFTDPAAVRGGVRDHRRGKRCLVMNRRAPACPSGGSDRAVGMPGADLDTCLAEVQATGHPDAAELSRKVAEFAASGAPLSIARWPN